MTDERLNQHLEAQLVQANATNAELRARVEEADRAEATARAAVSEANVRLQQLERAHAKQKAAEDNAAAAQRIQAEAERALRAVETENTELRARPKRAYADVAKLEALNERVRTAQRVEDLLAS